MTKKLLFIADSLPLQQEKARENLDFLFMLAAFEVQISILFMNEGIFQLLKTEHQIIHQHPFLPLLNALPQYDIHTLLVLKDSLIHFNMTEEVLIPPIKLIQKKELPRLFRSVDYIGR